MRMRYSGWLLAVVTGIILLASAHDVHATSPTETLQGNVNQVLELLRDPGLAKPEATSIRRAAVRQVVDGALDFPAMAERALGRHWDARTPEERVEFVSLFSALLETVYVGEIERNADQSITYLRELTTGNAATVQTKIGGKTETRVDYRMHERNGRWLVYDVTVGGLSVVDNFRSQLQRILRDSSYPTLIEKLREATGGQATGPSAAP
jgi:phospholipid transport system substrate-binding protein